MVIKTLNNFSPLGCELPITINFNLRVSQLISTSRTKKVLTKWNVILLIVHVLQGCFKDVGTTIMKYIIETNQALHTTTFGISWSSISTKHFFLIKFISQIYYWNSIWYTSLFFNLFLNVSKVQQVLSRRKHEQYINRNIYIKHAFIIVFILILAYKTCLIMQNNPKIKALEKSLNVLSKTVSTSILLQQTLNTEKHVLMDTSIKRTSCI